MESPYQVLTRERLAAVFQSDVLRRSPGPLPSVRAIDTHISRLRGKLHKAGFDCIRTMRHVGYRFVPPEYNGPASD
jgi:DNA-binding response OmpR family regulator